MTKEQFDIEFAAAQKQADEKAVELSAKFKLEVTPFVFYTKEGFVFGYIKNPDRMNKMKAIDLYEQSRTQAGHLILQTSLIHEESDKRILEESPENDAIYLGAIDFAIKVVQVCAELLKKK